MTGSALAARAQRGLGPDSRPVLLLVGSGGQAWREYVLRSLARHYGLWLISEREPSWEAPYLMGATRVEHLDLAAALPVARSVAARVPLAGVFSYDEVRVWHAARLAAALDLPGPSPDAVLACRDKRCSRELMAAAGVPQAASRSVSSLAEARAAAAAIGYPVILKPRGLAGSEGVVKVDGPAGLAAAFAFTAGAGFDEVPRYDSGGVLVEQYLDGPEISVDSLVDPSGTVRPVFVARKQLDMPPTFEETGHVVDAADPLLTRADVVDVVESAHRALGFTGGATHLELRLTRSGPKVVEVNARLGGDLIPHLGRLATGIDLPLLAASVAAGRRVAGTPTRRCAAAVRFLYPDADLVLDEVVVDHDRLPAGIREVLPVARPGQILRLPPASFVGGRYAAAIAVGPDPDACRSALDRIGDAVRPVGSPAPS